MSALRTSSPSALAVPAAGAPTALVIVGMHRSGTSALARCCNLLGVDLGNEFIPTRQDNEAGFWEDARVKDADDLALAAQGLLWDDVRPLPERWEEGRGIAEVRERLAATLAALAAPGRLFGVKDPRISRLLPLWLPLLEGLGATPGFLVALRHPAEVAHSLARRDGLTPARSHLLWLRYTLEAELHTRGQRRAIVPFDALLTDWRGTLARAARDLGIAWPVPPDEASREIEAFLDVRLRHHVAGDASAPAPAIERWTSEAYALLVAMREDDTQERRARLDRLRAGLAAADLVLSPVLTELEQEIASLRSGAGDDAAASGRSARERELDRARRELAVAHEVALTATARMEVERDAAEALREELLSTGAALEARAREVALLQARLESQTHEMELQSRELDACSSELEDVRRVLAGVERSLSWRLTAPLRRIAAAVRRSRDG
ncbi:MAG: hypothetical protein AB1689_26250 [Thermodesulfobacteriota bacterium]